MVLSVATQSEWLAAFEQRLQQWIASDIAFIELIETDLMAAGGKRVRPKLSYWCSQLMGGTNFDLELALAVELFHSASLLHDDLIDDADTRRGKEAAFRKYGNAISVLSGDFLLSRQLAVLASTGNIELVGMFAQAAKELTEGEVLQFQVAALETYSMANYIRIIEGKTAALTRIACEGIAVLAGCSLVWRKALASFGMAYGRAFQMRDDLLDLLGDPATLGKPVGSDVREGKLTLLTLMLHEQSAEARTILQRKGALEGDMQRLIALATELNLIPISLQLVQDQVNQALEGLAVLPDCEAKKALTAMALAEIVRLN